MQVTVRHRGMPYGTVTSPLLGRHNVQNLLAAVAVAHHLGLTMPQLAAGLVTFQNIKRRCEIRGVVHGITVIDDFAHHPTAVRVTIEAVRQSYPGARLWAVFEPRSATSRRAVFQHEFLTALQRADRVILADVHRKEQLAEADRLSPVALAQGLRERSVPAWFYPATTAMIEHLCREAVPTDVILIMSNGAFDNLHQRLLQALEERGPGPAMATSDPPGSVKS
jgi:UDP-N-acetylmuramate: L-alanyl-gamma-D-glutamyl-meso-diaminopimelate ligase